MYGFKYKLWSGFYLKYDRYKEEERCHHQRLLFIRSQLLVAAQRYNSKNKFFDRSD
jgi:hypothetical protein